MNFNNLKTKKKFLLLLLIFCLLTLCALIYIPKNVGEKEKIYFTAEKGQGSTIISNRLQQEGLIIWAPVFQFYVFTRGISSKLQAGEYELSKSMSINEIAEKLYRGEVATEEITVIEGWNLRDIAQKLADLELFQKEDFFTLAGFPLNENGNPKDYSQDFSFLKDKPKNLNLEGYLFPDTYEIRKGATTDELIKKALFNFEQKIAPYRDKISASGKKIFDIITIASMIEKEVKTLEDKKLASGIIWKRLKVGMALNIDATLTYILDRSLNIDTKIDSPYNTYKYGGLPLGPICNPGLESIQAAIYPKESPYFYYLSAPDGKTIFSKTLSEHNLAIEKYLK